MDDAATMVRLYFKEGDTGDNKRLIDAILDLVRAQGIGGATAFRGITGFGAHGQAQADLLHLAGNLPLVVEFFAPPDTAEATMTELRRHFPKLHIVHWSASMRR